MTITCKNIPQPNCLSRHSLYVLSGVFSKVIFTQAVFRHSDVNIMCKTVVGYRLALGSFYFVGDCPFNGNAQCYNLLLKILLVSQDVQVLKFCFVELQYINNIYPV